MKSFRCIALLLIPLLCATAIAQQVARPPWTTSRIMGAPEPPRPYIAERIFPSLVFNQPLELVAVPASDRLLVLEQTGKIYSFENRPGDEKLTRDLFADIKPRDSDFTHL